ncbi:hypothetical protein GMOD_00005534 [Pyrenophora seminiperda CCB06]|uniref:Uncharacterized protein n=1 Tax=Pyrenophora seminiperda CCB06 TaxID=1302712 RepID=A0A3M7M9C0_9PLEO|nr:hypothetical protein GMOD_00005534 [Pyrenophora seminiperda CCB06]
MVALQRRRPHTQPARTLPASMPTTPNQHGRPPWLAQRDADVHFCSPFPAKPVHRCWIASRPACCDTRRLLLMPPRRGCARTLLADRTGRLPKTDAKSGLVSRLGAPEQPPTLLLLYFEQGAMSCEHLPSELFANSALRRRFQKRQVHCRRRLIGRGRPPPVTTRCAPGADLFRLHTGSGLGTPHLIPCVPQSREYRPARTHALNIKPGQKRQS